jgi:alpha-amylase
MGLRKRLLSVVTALVVTANLLAAGTTKVYAENVKSKVTYSEVQSGKKPFSWDNATVYFALTDRFLDGDSSNNHSYGRELDLNGKEVSGYKDQPATFHGGDLKGMTQKVQEGYFDNLGVNAIWITAPYEQIHGWTGGDGFRHYAYHGYYTLDYTSMDKNMGSEQDLQQFIDTAHSHGIRVVFDVVMNHAGYPTLKDMDEFGFGKLTSNWKDYYYGSPSDASWSKDPLYMDMSDYNSWQKWWSPAWIRKSPANLGNNQTKAFPGYDGSEGGDDKTICLSGLPDFKTETTTDPGLPPLLVNKWTKEGRLDSEKSSLDAFFSKSGLQRRIENYQVKWLTDWVRKYGVDGFRCDTAKHVNIDAWKNLKDQAVAALREWKAANPTKKIDDSDFWMTGESWGHGVSRDSYFDNGFDSMINFSFQPGGRDNKDATFNMSTLDSTFSSYASAFNSQHFSVLNYISSHDTKLYNRNDLTNAATALLLAPGAAQIYYGDETARPWGFDNCSYADQKTRTDMNWTSENQAVLSHWQKIGQFRNNHLAVGAGTHTKIADSPYTFSRSYNKNGIADNVVVVIGASGSTAVNVSSLFGDGTQVRDAYTGATTVVNNGTATFTAGSAGVILIETLGDIPVVSAAPGSQTFYTDTIDVNLSLNKASSGNYVLDNGAPVSFTDGTKITIGSGMSFGQTRTLKISASNTFGTSTQTYTYRKADPNAATTVHFYKPSGWSNPNIYYYDDTKVKQGPAWPGVAMTDEGNGWFGYKIDKWESAKVIFNSGSSQIPAAQQSGFDVTGEKWYMNGVWYNTKPSINPTASIKVHFYNITGWGTPNIYYYDDTKVKQGPAWPGVAMVSEGNGWYVYTINDWSKAKVLFNSGAKQLPGSGQAGFDVTGEMWYKNGTWYTSQPTTFTMLNPLNNLPIAA